jgi:hypothetical protein
MAMAEPQWVATTEDWIKRVHAVTDPLARRILTLHSRDSNGYCQGDEGDGELLQPPNWPCLTVELVMDFLDNPAPPDASELAWHCPRPESARPNRRQELP